MQVKTPDGIHVIYLTDAVLLVLLKATIIIIVISLFAPSCRAHQQVLSLARMLRQPKGSPHRQENRGSSELVLLPGRPPAPSLRLDAGKSSSPRRGP